MRYCALNGEILPEADAKVGIMDIGLLRGFGAYEAMAAQNGVIFRWEDHITRFRKTAEFLGVPLPLNDKEIKQAIRNLIEKNDLAQSRANVKCILTGGTAIGGIEPDPRAPTFYIFTEEWQPLAEAYYAKGAKVITHEHLRHYPQYKTTNYITAARLQKEMRAAGALEILYTWQERALECATSNFFIVKDDALITAKDDVLHGVTRNVVLELARENGIAAEERAYTLAELHAADEAFLTSSFKDVVPVVVVDERAIGAGAVGETTKEVMRLFAEYFTLVCPRPELN